MIVFRVIAGGLAPLTLLGTLSAFFYPAPFLLVKSIFLWLFAATMFALGVVLEPSELRQTLHEPRKIFFGVCTQFTVMPLLGFAVAWFSGLQPDLALGLIIVACAPGAMASNVIVYLAGGAVAYSVALTTVATFLAPLLTPSLVQLLGGVFVPIPFWSMVQTILLTVVVPLVLGMGLRRYLGSALAIASEVAPAVATLAIAIICSYAVAANAERISTAGSLLFGMVVGINALGYLLGFGAGALFRFDRRHKITLAIEIGMQNAGLGVALALTHFSPQTALPGALFAVWCILTAAGVTGYLRYRGRIDAADPVGSVLEDGLSDMVKAP